MQVAEKNKGVGLSKPREEQDVLKAMSREDYLRSKGWTDTHPGAPSPAKPWRDPTTGQPEKQIVGFTKKVNGKDRQSMQTKCSSAAWYYTLDEALAVQRGREAKAK